MLKALRLPRTKSDVLSINTNNVWFGLNKKIIRNENIILEGFDDIYPYNGGPVFMANKVFIMNCDKNFVYYWLDKSTFPNANTIYLCSHPCEPPVLSRKFNEIKLLDHYQCYKNRWAFDLDNVKIITQKEINDELSKYEHEDIIIEEKKEE
ncbi:hypothetical protein QJ856_gp1071 [Tupanvirus deep ocean]|uniref:Uncharacterized protein n=2 Tax=Tupanvirus TaxID=2094720 RepID=A0AC62A7C0_9VIRU|nr:hypothetical protein QJ856_gp1071 [Tupanvirus deep ocean]QKU33686.1 hypothetical protein [Tupanvirus deep ocean]